MSFNNQEKKEIVNSVFSSVNQKYDLMNDILSFGIHRIWKKNLITWMHPQKGDKLIDVASGTGDLAGYFSKKCNHNCKVYCVEPNKDMFEIGKRKLKKYSNIKWYLNSAEKLPFEDDSFDFYTISFGMRNVTDINMSISEALRVLKTGGRFFCLEFSKVENEILRMFYKNYSKIIPSIGKFVTGDKNSYAYLVNSINKFHNQIELKELIEKNGFSNVEYRNLSNGIAAIHTGWKI